MLNDREVLIQQLLEPILDDLQPLLKKTYNAARQLMDYSKNSDTPRTATEIYLWRLHEDISSFVINNRLGVTVDDETQRNRS